MSRKILYSPGYGAGWTSWSSCSRAQQLFMLEYKPFIDALDAATNEDMELTPWNFPGSPSYLTEEYPKCLVKLIPQFLADWKERFGDEDPPYFGGISDLEVYAVPDGALVRIVEYDGYERVEVQGTFEGWL